MILLMRNERGITLTSLVVYCVILMIVIGIVSVMTANVQQNMSTIKSLKGYITEVNKLSMYMVDETKNGSNDVVKISGDGASIEFKNGNKYIFAVDSIYKVSSDNRKIKICDNVEGCKFRYILESNQKVVKVALQFVSDGQIVNKNMEYVFTI